MAKEMLINTVEGKECRIAIVDKGVLEELYVERVSSASRVGNIYKGRVTNIEPSIQAAFVDFGLPKNGFLHISDVYPDLFPGGKKGSESVGKKRAHRDRPPIQECLRRGQEVVVQITKEGIGTKGPTLTTYLSIPGRLLVAMPGMNKLGVSRKIEDEQDRAKARDILAELKTPSDMGFIVRTAGLGRSTRDFNRDLSYLQRLWKAVKKRIKEAKAPAEIYQESDLVTRTIRDVYNTDIDRVICDNEGVARKVREFLNVAMPRTKHVIELYVGREGLFHAYGLESEIERIYSRRVELASGGSLVIDPTEALVAIDINSGRFREHSNAETNALKINQEAAREIVRQLRLRDLGGMIVIDFIDLREEKNRRAVERTLRDELRSDRAKTKVLKMSSFGIVEMTRQRVRPSLKHSLFRTCTHCEGAGLIKSEESQALLVLRNLQRATSNDQVASVEISVTPVVAHHLANNQRTELAQLEQQTGKKIIIRADADLGGDALRVTCFSQRGTEVAWDRQGDKGAKAKEIETLNIDDVPRTGGVPQAPLAGIDEHLPGDEGKGEPQKAKPKSKSTTRKRSRRRKPKDASAATATEAAETAEAAPQPDKGDEPAKKTEKKTRRRRSRGGRKHKKKTATRTDSQAPNSGDNENGGNSEPPAGAKDASNTTSPEPQPAEAAE